MWTIIGLLVLGLILAIIWLAATAPVCDENEQPVVGLQAVEFPEQTMVIGKGSTVYKPLPALVREDDLKGEVITCWELTFGQRIQVLLTGRLWASTWTFGNAFQPLFFSTQKTDVLRPESSELEY